ncbi:hypothetical protein KSF_002710 [Reticulibacter mediterranei]|uniref:Tryptophan synthase beta chain-like PALP domain-containing protein n=1 Tax=Reticulibacter mediterranei TaxID=2778369 RepID=A0A8J3ICZ7_9CHLR|nr:cytochrome P450 [Reticulibacter mediterranei]GHO90223.1 hypothetical protein KSF_002710 [Reticulibacter mediterranei]
MQLVHLWGTERPSSFYQHVLQTPLRSYTGAQAHWKEHSLKDEIRQITKAFKFRGNCYRLLCALPTSKVVTAASAGSHGLGLSIAARIRGIQAHIFVPDNTVRAKTQAKVDDDYEQEFHQVYYDEERASWLVFHYEDVQQVLLDPQTFSSQRTFNPDGSIDPLVDGGLIGMDPPHHRHMRAFIAQAFTPRVVAQFEPQIRAIVQELLDQVQHKGTMDFVDDLAFPSPVLFIAKLLGVPGGDREQFRRWTTDFVGPDYELRKETAKNIADYFQEIIKQRRREPREDVMTKLLQAQGDREHLHEQDVLGTCQLLLIAGHETTTSLLSNALVCLDEHPEVQSQLVEQPELQPGAIEEVRRYRGVVHTMVRVVTKDTVLCGQPIKAGNLVLPLFASTNLDEAQ